MRLRRIKFLQLALIGLIVFGAFNGAMCYQLCTVGNGGANPSQPATCSVGSHALIHSEIIFSALFILPLLGVLLILTATMFSAGFFTPPLRPPRLFA